MGELRAYALDLAELHDLLAGAPEQRERAAALVAAALPPTASPAPLGPIFTRVPDSRVVRDDDPAPADLDRFLGGEPVPEGRTRATWRLAEALVTGLSTAAASSPSERPEGLRPPPFALPALGDAAAGTWAFGQAQGLPGLRVVADAARSTPRLAVLVFWSAREGRGPTG